MTEEVIEMAKGLTSDEIRRIAEIDMEVDRRISEALKVLGFVRFQWAVWERGYHPKSLAMSVHLYREDGSQKFYETILELEEDAAKALREASHEAAP